VRYHEPSKQGEIPSTIQDLEAVLVPFTNSLMGCTHTGSSQGNSNNLGFPTNPRHYKILVKVEIELFIWMEL
jgi:hypothetical protein